MSKHRDLRVHAFALFKEVDQAREKLQGTELGAFLESVRKLPTNMEDRSATRYSEVGSGDERCLLFSDELGVQLDKRIVGGVFTKRRATSRPFEEDAEGHLLELHLANQKSEIAEAAYFAMHIEEGILFWVSHQMVGGMTAFKMYMNSKHQQSMTAGLANGRLEFKGQSASFYPVAIIYPDAPADFEKRMREVFSMEIELAGTSEDFKQLYLGDQKNEVKELHLIKSMASSSGCAKLSIGFLSEIRGRPSKDKPRMTLLKPYLLQLYASLRPALEANEGSRCYVRGKMVDEETRLLDLLHANLVYEVPISYEGPHLPVPEVLQRMQTELLTRLSEAARLGK